MPESRGIAAPQPRYVPLHGIGGEVPVYQGGELPPGYSLRGPALVVEPVATTYVMPGWEAATDRLGNLLLEQQGPPS